MRDQFNVEIFDETTAPTFANGEYKMSNSNILGNKDEHDWIRRGWNYFTHMSMLESRTTHNGLPWAPRSTREEYEKKYSTYWNEQQGLVDSVLNNPEENNVTVNNDKSFENLKRAYDLADKSEEFQFVYEKEDGSFGYLPTTSESMEKVLISFQWKSVVYSPKYKVFNLTK